MFTSIRLFYYSWFPPPPDKRIKEILEEFSAYYSRLNENEQERFVNRINVFLKFIAFHSASQEYVSYRMRILIASAFIQITFGLKRFILRHFKDIIIQPGLYHIPEMKDKLIGHVDKRKKTITLSWPNAEHGFKISDDAQNVALHEMTHVILFENSLRLQFTEFFHRVHWDDWLYHSQRRFLINQKRKNLLLAEYADTNLLEMFAVSVETFFERPEIFKRTLPTLFDSLSNLLQQDPTRSENPCLITLER